MKDVLADVAASTLSSFISCDVELVWNMNPCDGPEPDPRPTSLGNISTSRTQSAPIILSVAYCLCILVKMTQESVVGATPLWQSRVLIACANHLNG